MINMTVRNNSVSHSRRRVSRRRFVMSLYDCLI